MGLEEFTISREKFEPKPGFEPRISRLPAWCSCQFSYPSESVWHLSFQEEYLNMGWNGNLDSSIGKSARVVIWRSEVRILVQVRIFILKSKLKSKKITMSTVNPNKFVIIFQSQEKIVFLTHYIFTNGNKTVIIFNQKRTLTIFRLQGKWLFFSN